MILQKTYSKSHELKWICPKIYQERALKIIHAHFTVTKSISVRLPYSGLCYGFCIHLLFRTYLLKVEKYVIHRNGEDSFSLDARKCLKLETGMLLALLYRLSWVTISSFSFAERPRITGFSLTYPTNQIPDFTNQPYR